MFNELISGLKFMFRPSTCSSKKHCGKYSYCGWTNSLVASAVLALLIPAQTFSLGDLSSKHAFVYWIINTLIYALVIGLVMSYAIHAILRVISKNNAPSTASVRFMLASSLFPAAAVALIASVVFSNTDRYNAYIDITGASFGIGALASIWGIIILTIGLQHHGVSFIKAFVLSLVGISAITVMPVAISTAVSTRLLFASVSHEECEANSEYRKDQDKIISTEGVFEIK
ncbi:MAG: hypothetical protein KAH32_00920 [Chlamydiia bacterium]|nr:hypothetical protein [Chlamydiia bacterium]